MQARPLCSSRTASRRWRGLDKIIFLEDGKVEAVGPHDQLYASCPEYRKMVDLQKLEDEVGGGNA